jgi:hypothetical protein
MLKRLLRRFAPRNDHLTELECRNSLGILTYGGSIPKGVTTNVIFSDGFPHCLQQPTMVGIFETCWASSHRNFAKQVNSTAVAMVYGMKPTKTKIRSANLGSTDHQNRVTINRPDAFVREWQSFHTMSFFKLRSVRTVS